MDDGSVHTPPNYTTFVPPAKGGSYIDPVFGCTSTRLTDGQGDFRQNGGHNYIRSAFNADNTKFLAYETNTGNFYVVDRATGNVLVAPAASGSLTFGGDTADETWDRTNANIIYLESGNQLLKADVSACTLSAPCDGAHGTSVGQTGIHTFSEYTTLDANNNKKDISDDGCYYPMGGTTSAGNFDAFWYNICSNTKGSVQTCPASAASHFISGMTHSNRMWVAWGGSGTSSCLGTWFFDNNMNPLQQLFTIGPHSTAVYDPVANKEYLVYEASGDSSNQVCNSGATSGIGKTDLQTFAKSCVIAFPYALANVHVTANNPYGWWGYESTDNGGTANDNSTLSSTWQNSWGHLYNEIGVGSISTGQIYRLAHSRTRTGGAAPCGGYWTATWPSMSFDGTQIAFDSSMARTNAPLPACIQDYVDAYVIKFR